jgi:hypothetical protein
MGSFHLNEESHMPIPVVVLHGCCQMNGTEQAVNDAAKDGLAHIPDIGDLRVPFYADILNDFVSGEDVGPLAVDEEGELGEGLMVAFALELDAQGELPQAPADTAGIRTAVLSWKRRLKAWAEKKGYDWVAIKHFWKDVAAYLENEDVRQKVRDRLSPELPDGPFVLVGHSLGAVVALDLLASRNSTDDIPLLLTLGGPLGVKVIQSHLGKDAAVHPQNVELWVNAYDEDDHAAALNPLTDPPFSGVVEKIVNSAPDDAHGLTGYLASGELADDLRQALGQ